MKNLKEFADAITDEKLNAFIEKYNKQRSEAGGKALTPEQIKKMRNRRTGDTGRAVGSTYELTGKIDFAYKITDDAGSVLNTYEAAETTSGEWISITQLLGISSLSGYKTDGEVEHDYRLKANEKSPIIHKPVKCEVVKDFDFDDVWQPPTRIKLVFLAMLNETPDLLKGAKLRYLGIVAKSTTARKDAPSDFSEQYIAGDKRAMVAKLWHVELA